MQYNMAERVCFLLRVPVTKLRDLFNDFVFRTSEIISSRSPTHTRTHTHISVNCILSGFCVGKKDMNTEIISFRSPMRIHALTHISVNCILSGFCVGKKDMNTAINQ